MRAKPDRLCQWLIRRFRGMLRCFDCSLNRRRSNRALNDRWRSLEALEQRLFLSATAMQPSSTTPPTTVQIGSDGSVYVRLGNPNSASPMHGNGGIALEGGGTDVDQAFQWMIGRMGGKGDFLVLSASDSTDVVRGVDAFDYNPYIFNFGGANSVATLTIPNRAAAIAPSVTKIIESADAIFITGGSQNDYLDWWKGTPVQYAISNAVARGVPVGGTSAGADVWGQFIYSAEYDSIRSTQAMTNPFDPNMTFDRNFVAPNELPFLNNTMIDTHFENRNRLGRMTAFLARVNTSGWSANHKPMGIGIDQETALLISPNGHAQVVGNVTASHPGVDFLMTPGLPQVDQPGQPLTYSSIQVEHVGFGGTFDLSNWNASFGVSNSVTTHSTVSVTKGSILVSPVAKAAGISRPIQVAAPPKISSTIVPTNGEVASKWGSVPPFAAGASLTFAPTSFADSDQTVPNQVVSLRDAVIAANRSTTTGAVTIDLKAGEYLLSLPQTGLEDGTGGNLVDSNSNHTLIIKGNGTSGAGATIIDARELNDRIFQMLPGTTVILEDLILTGGLASDNGFAGQGIARGGAILDQGRSLTLNDVWVIANKAQGGTDTDAQGGGIYSAGGKLAVYGSLISMNTAAGGHGGKGTGANGGNAQGGGLYAAAGSIVLGNAFAPDKIDSNVATGGVGGSGVTSGVGGSGGNGQGGGIYAGGGSLALNLSMSHVTMASNFVRGGSGSSASGGTGGNGGAAQGAGLFVGGGSVSIKATNDAFQSNRASGGGGTQGGAGGLAQGAGLYLSAGSLALSSDTFTRNIALGGNGSGGGDAQGGGVFAKDGAVGLTGDVFSANVALGGACTSGALSGGVGQGGGLYAGAGSLNLWSDAFQFNEALGGSGGDDASAATGGKGGAAAGGGLYSSGDSLTVKSVGDRFVLNMAAGGRGGDAGNGGDGGMGLGGGADFNASSLTIQWDLVDFNTAIGGIGGLAGIDGNGGAGGEGDGGGLFVKSDSSQFPLKIRFNLVEANLAAGGFGGGAMSGGVGGAGGDGQGGGLFLDLAQPVLTTDFIALNKVASGVGGLAATNGVTGESRGPNTFLASAPIPS